MYIYWLVVDLPPCKIWVRQIGSSQLLRKIKFMFQTTNIPPTSKFCGWKWLKRVVIHRDGPHNTINSSNHMCSTQKTSVIIHLRWWINSIFLFRLNINWTLRPEASGTSWDDETEIWRNSSWRAFVRSDYPTHPDSVPSLRFRFSKFGMQLMMAEWATQPAKHDKKQLTRRPAFRLRRDDITRSIWKMIPAMTSIPKYQNPFPYAPCMVYLRTFEWFWWYTYFIHGASGFVLGESLSKATRWSLVSGPPNHVQLFSKLPQPGKALEVPKNHWFWRFPDVEISCWSFNVGPPQL